ncbi:MAG TPA: hypothetical protein VFI61_01890 [Patescibacteria group bacterium]|nr:hypothetical protein [Patescibacteria group bacterium]
MSEGNLPHDGGDDKPFIEEAIIRGAESISKKTGHPIPSILDTAEKEAEQNEDFFVVNIYKKIKKRLFGN